jgi:hypothetical protein
LWFSHSPERGTRLTMIFFSTPTISALVV